MIEVRTVEEVNEGVITRELLDKMWSNWPDHETARFLDLRMRKLESQAKRNFIETGVIALEVSERSLWKEMFDPETGEVFTSFDNWISNCAPVSRSSIYESMRVLKALPDLSVETMKEIPRTNLRTLAGVSSKVGRDANVIEAAKTLPEKKFKEKIQEEYPDQRVEQEDGMFLAFTKSQKSVFLDALLAISKEQGCSNWTEAAEALAVSYLNDYNAWPEMKK